MTTSKSNNKHELITREQFREAVFARDNYACVLCGDRAEDAHHILERRLFPDGGYYINNGASVCQSCHRECEKTTISVEHIRQACGITKPVIPPHLYPDTMYDKWGNPILQNGQRLKGELFYDQSVQKILREGGVLDLFTEYVKYPRTYHLPWSDGMHQDDRMMSSDHHFLGHRVIVTEKIDGENTTMYNDHIHARSVDGRSHPSQDVVKNIWSQIAHEIPDQWRICGENAYAEHSIHYNELPSYLLGFSIWNDKNECLSWDETIEWFELLGITSVPIWYDGLYDDFKHDTMWSDDMWDRCEGYVIRKADCFSLAQFPTSVGKFVRRQHIRTTKHWKHGQQVTPNELANK